MTHPTAARTLALTLALTAATLTATASQAAANPACPTHADLAAGVTLTRSAPALSIAYVQSAAGLTETKITPSQSGPVRQVSTYPHPLAVGDQTRPDGTVLSLRYRGGTTALDDLIHTKTLTRATTLSIGGKMIDQGTTRWQLLSTGTTRIGGCAYPTWEVRETMTLQSITLAPMIKTYAPDLGEVLAVSRLDEAGKPVSIARFDHIRKGRPK